MLSEQFQDDPAAPRMMVIRVGEFVMGTDRVEDPMYEDESPARALTIGTPFALGVLPVTMREMATFAQQSNALSMQHCAFLEQGATTDPDVPAVMTSWRDARAYCQWLTQVTGRKYRLPAEREWEYSCRAGTTTAYWWGDQFDSFRANCRSQQVRAKIIDGVLYQVLSMHGTERRLSPPRSFDKTELILEALTVVTAFPPNPWGLYDMLGNTWEWVEDWYEEQHRAPEQWLPRLARSEESFRSMRGGSWLDPERSLRCATRSYSSPSSRDRIFGFRVACEVSR